MKLGDQATTTYGPSSEVYVAVRASWGPTLKTSPGLLLSLVIGTNLINEVQHAILDDTHLEDT